MLCARAMLQFFIKVQNTWKTSASSLLSCKAAEKQEGRRINCFVWSMEYLQSLHCSPDNALQWWHLTFRNVHMAECYFRSPTQGCKMSKHLSKTLRRIDCQFVLHILTVQQLSMFRWETKVRPVTLSTTINTCSHCSLDSRYLKSFILKHNLFL